MNRRPLKNPAGRPGLSTVRKERTLSSSKAHPGEATIEHRAVYRTELGITPPLELLNLVGNEHFDRFCQLFLEEGLIETHLLEDRFDVFKHRKHEGFVDWLE